MVAQGVPVKDAYARAGYKGNDQSRSDLRRSFDVDARVKWLLMRRVEADTEARHKSEKKRGDLKDRVLEELARVALSDARDLVQWDREPILDEQGNVQGFRDVMTATPSRKLSRSQAAAVRSVTTKSGALKIDVHDKLAALDKLARALGLFTDSAPVSQSITVNQVNVGEVQALEAARRVAFLLSQASPASEAAPLIEHEPRRDGKP